MVTKKQIRGAKDGKGPWYGVQISGGVPEIVSDNDGGTTFDMANVSAKTPAFVDLPNPAAAAMNEDVIYSVTEGGEFISHKQGADLADHGVSLRAQLAWYDADTDEFTVLEFVE